MLPLRKFTPENESVEPVLAPRREASAIPVRPRAAAQDRSPLYWLLAVAALMAAGIAYMHLRPGAPGQGMQMGGVDAGAQVLAGGGFQPGTGGPRIAVKEAPLEKAQALPQERFAAPVMHVNDKGICATLRTQRNQVQAQMAKPHSAAQGKEYQLDLKSISQRGTQEGCWSGGA